MIAYPATNRETHEEAEAAWAKRFPWLLPLATSIFLGAAVFEMMPEALEIVVGTGWLWLVVVLILFILVKDGLDYIGQRGLPWVATRGIWLHSFMEGTVTATCYQVDL